jgi:hypothetical protein
MAEPTPIYPDAEPILEPSSRVVAINHHAEGGFKSGYASSFDRTISHAGRSFRQLRDTAQNEFMRIKRTAIYVAQERPVQLVFGVAIAAFAAGSGLRIWRSHHE